MATRAEDRAAARERRRAAELAETRRTRRRRRLSIVAGGVAAVAIVAVVVAVLLGGGHHRAVGAGTPAARATDREVTRLLSGIPQSGAALGDPHAPVTVEEFADLQCPYCAQFAAGDGDELIARQVRPGHVRLVYRAVATASSDDPGAFIAQQTAALAAGAQHHGWNYLEIFYREQGAEGSGYVTQPFLAGVAAQVPGLDLARWRTDRTAAGLGARVAADGRAAAALGIRTTPTFVVTGPHRRVGPFSTLSYATIAAAIARAR